MIFFIMMWPGIDISYDSIVVLMLLNVNKSNNPKERTDGTVEKLTDPTEACT